VGLVSILTIVVGSLLNADPERIARIIGRMRIAILPLFALIFFLDCVTSPGIAVPMLYAVPVLITSLCVSIEWSFASAVLATVLTYMGYYVSPPSGNTEEGYVNRLIAAVLIWACVLLGWLLGYVRKEIQTFYDQRKGLK
jgi:hypothetical protein